MRFNYSAVSTILEWRQTTNAEDEHIVLKCSKGTASSILYKTRFNVESVRDSFVAVRGRFRAKKMHTWNSLDRAMRADRRFLTLGVYFDLR